MPEEEGLNKGVDQNDGKSSSHGGPCDAINADEYVVADYGGHCGDHLEHQVVTKVRAVVDQQAVVAIGNVGQLADAQKDGHVFTCFKLRAKNGDDIVQVDDNTHKDEHAGGKIIEGGAAVELPDLVISFSFPGIRQDGRSDFAYTYMGQDNDRSEEGIYDVNPSQRKIEQGGDHQNVDLGGDFTAQGCKNGVKTITSDLFKMRAPEDRKAGLEVQFADVISESGQAQDAQGETPGIQDDELFQADVLKVVQQDQGQGQQAAENVAKECRDAGPHQGAQVVLQQFEVAGERQHNDQQGVVGFDVILAGFLAVNLQDEALGQVEDNGSEDNADGPQQKDEAEETVVFQAFISKIWEEPDNGGIAGETGQHNEQSGQFDQPLGKPQDFLPHITGKKQGIVDKTYDQPNVHENSRPNALSLDASHFQLIP